jgi:hypothetical protein
MKGPTPPAIEEILDALARPWVELRERSGGQHYSRLIAREAGDPRESSRGIVKEMLDPIAIEFIAAMERALPGRSRAEIHWAYYFFIGALLLILANPARMRRQGQRGPDRRHRRLCRAGASRARRTKQAVASGGRHS